MNNSEPSRDKYSVSFEQNWEEPEFDKPLTKEDMIAQIIEFLAPFEWNEKLWIISTLKEVTMKNLYGEIEAKTSELNSLKQILKP